MVTTIQLSDDTKSKLDKMKQSSRKTYDEIVKSLLKQHAKVSLREQVAEYYAEYADEDLAEVREFVDEKW